MKKIVLTAVALMAFGFVSQAQEIKFGAKAGVNFASQGGDVEDVNSRTGFHVGAVAEFKFTEQFSLQPELVYSQQGYKVEGEDFGVSYEGTSKLDYINIPIMAKYYLFEGFSLHAGPQVGFNISAKGESEVGGETEEGDIEDVSAIDFGVAGGAEYELPMGLFFQARYYTGLSNTYDGEGSDDYKASNNVISVSVGYKF